MKKFIYGLIVAWAVLSVRADYLLWEVNALEDGAVTGTSEAPVPSQDDSVVVFDGSVDIADGRAYSFYIELVNSVGFADGKFSMAQYKDLAGLIAGSLSEMPSVPYWHGGSGTWIAAPEPTCAGLMLLGVASLALKRKRRKQA